MNKSTSTTKKAGESLDVIRLRKLLQRAVRREKAPENLRMKISRLIREK